MYTRILVFLSLLMALLLSLVGSPSSASQITGAIWTTDSTGTTVNQNIYAAKTDVYLNGGPKNGGAGLPDGFYYCRVTDPSGAVVLGGTVDPVVPVVNGVMTISPFQLFGTLYLTNPDGSFILPLQHGYADTPNPGGEYKVWISSVPDYKNSDSKTDNFKVKPPTILGQISGFKFEDMNENGVWDDGESALGGWSITLTGPNGIIITTTTSSDPDNLGYYEFTNLLPGDYTVSETMPLPDGWKETCPVSGSYAIPISSGTDAYDNNFGNFCLGQISGYKFEDVKGDGTDLAPVEGWQITLTYPDGSTKTISTNAGGYYEFTGLDAGDYTVSEQTDPAVNPETPTCIGPITVISRTDSKNNNFINFWYGKISGYKYEDVKGDGTDLKPVKGWQITLTYPDGSKKIISTDANGYYKFDNLLAGNYTVSEQTDPAVKAETPISIGPITVISRTDSTCNNFTNFWYGKITGYKFYDTNGNGKWDAGETALAKWKITLTGKLKNGTPITPIVTYTDANGCYTFTGLNLGSYTIMESHPTQSNWMQTCPAAPGTYAVTINQSRQVAADNNFGNVALGCGGGLTLGFWSNKNGQALITTADVTFLCGLNLVNSNGSAFNPTAKSQVATWLLGANATNMACMLSAQLTAMELNVRHNFVNGGALIYAPGTNSANSNGFATVNAVMTEANNDLAGNTYVLSGNLDRAHQQALKDALDNANNNRTFILVPPSIPPYSF